MLAAAGTRIARISSFHGTRMTRMNADQSMRYGSMLATVRMSRTTASRAQRASLCTRDENLIRGNPWKSASREAIDLAEDSRALEPAMPPRRLVHQELIAANAPPSGTCLEPDRARRRHSPRVVVRGDTAGSHARRTERTGDPPHSPSVCSRQAVHSYPSQRLNA